MTILLLVLLVVCVAMVSAPISIRFVRLILARNRFRELPLLRGIDGGPCTGAQRRRQCST